MIQMAAREDSKRTAAGWLGTGELDDDIRRYKFKLNKLLEWKIMYSMPPIDGSFRDQLPLEVIDMIAKPLAQNWSCSYCGATNAGSATMCHACLKPNIMYMIGAMLFGHHPFPLACQK
jgi:ribosomal protein L40E